MYKKFRRNKSGYPAYEMSICKMSGYQVHKQTEMQTDPEKWVREVRMISFDDKGFEEAVGSILQPWLRDHVSAGKFTSFDDTRIQYYSAVHPKAKAVIVMLHGFCEFFGKFHETAYDFWENGYTVYFIEHRGHGGSDRQCEDPDVVDVNDFSEYVEDLKCFLDKVVLPQTQGLFTRAAMSGAHASGAGAVSARGAGKLKLLMYAHSMGGCIGTMFLERYPEYFSAAVLTSPMLKMTFGKTPLWQVKGLMAVSKLLGWGDKLMPGMQRFDPEKPDFETSGSTSPARFQYQFDIRKDPSTGGIYTMNCATYRWGHAAWKATAELSKDMDKIRIPVLICQAGHDYYVDNEGQNELAEKAKYVKLVRFPESQHEIYASDEKTLEQYYREILGFFQRAVDY